MIAKNETYSEIIKGFCSYCGRPHEKIINSNISIRKDKIRYSRPEDDEGWCIFRCKNCGKIIEETFKKDSK